MLLLQLVREVIEAAQPTVVFIATKYHVEFLHHLFERQGISAACVYGSMDQASAPLPPPRAAQTPRCPKSQLRTVSKP